MDARRESEPTPMKNRTTVERKFDRELVTTRTFNGPARIVFEAWTRPELFKRWWAPKSMGMSLHSCEMDVRVGGKYRLEFENDAMAFFGTYLEVIPHSRLVWTNEESGESGPVTTVTFEEKGDDAAGLHLSSKGALDAPAPGRRTRGRLAWTSFSSPWARAWDGPEIVDRAVGRAIALANAFCESAFEGGVRGRHHTQARSAVHSRRDGVRARPARRFGHASRWTAALRESCGRRPADRGAGNPAFGSDAADARPDRRGGRAPAERHHHDRSSARERPARGHRDRGRPVPRAFARRADRGEGPLLYARRSHHGRHEGLCRFRARLRRDRRRAAGSFGCDHPRQARPVRGCVRTLFPRFAGAREPVGRNAMERRLIERPAWRRRQAFVSPRSARTPGDRSGTRRPRTGASASSPRMVA